MLSSTCTSETPLDFLFVGEPMAEAMRQQVREDLDQVEHNIRNTLVTLVRSLAIQLSTANSGLADFLDTTPELISLLLTFATAEADVETYLADLPGPARRQAAAADRGRHDRPAGADQHVVRRAGLFGRRDPRGHHQPQDLRHRRHDHADARRRLVPDRLPAPVIQFQDVNDEQML